VKPTPPPAPTLRSRIVPATAAVVAITALAGAAWYGLDAISTQPIRHVVFMGDLEKIARADLEAFASSVQGASASGASLLAVREAARTIPWVRDATVRRRFPDAVEIAFETHDALARWNEGALVSVRGEVFNAKTDGFLPRFAGPAGSAAQMAREYPLIREALAPLASAVTELRLSPRAAWQVVLESGLSLDLGRGDIHPRLARFVAAWPQLAVQGVETRRADLRYANGFAMQRGADVKPASHPAAGPAPRKTTPRRENQK
jgi:cell division protein FtsQ